MPDSATPTPAPAATPTSVPTPTTAIEHGDFHQGQLETVRKSEGISRAASKAEYLPKLIAEGMLAETPEALLAKAREWRELSRRAVSATQARERNTDIGGDTAEALQEEVDYYRSKARLLITLHPEWGDTEKDALKARYFINKDIFNSRALAEQSVEAILANAAEDALPGITPERQTLVGQKLLAYSASETPQTDAQSDATKLRGQRDAAFAEVLRLRHQIQFAADGAYPWQNDLNLGIRREFLLPAGRPFAI